ncbi:neurocalcin-delta-like [Dreissena polymorpha]|nr:neurocalcin-delta-like [Dreissena polymorpha]
MGSGRSKVRQLDPKTLTDLQNTVDGKGKSKLTKQKFRSVYNSVFDGDADEFVGHLFRSFDSNQDGFVDFKEFIVGLCVSGSEKPETKLKLAFNMYDQDGNGSISREEVSPMSYKLTYSPVYCFSAPEFIVGLCVSGSEKPEIKLKLAFHMYDQDGNGSISREEMSNMLKVRGSRLMKGVKSLALFSFNHMCEARYQVTTT